MKRIDDAQTLHRSSVLLPQPRECAPGRTRRRRRTKNESAVSSSESWRDYTSRPALATSYPRALATRRQCETVKRLRGFVTSRLPPDKLPFPAVAVAAEAEERERKRKDRFRAPLNFRVAVNAPTRSARRASKVKYAEFAREFR